MDTTIVKMALSGVVGSLIGAVGVYLNKRAENFATKQDFETLLAQVKATTEATERIRTQISQTASVGQSDLDFRKQQLAEFYGPIYAHLKTAEELYDLWMSKRLHEINEEIKDLFRANNEEIIRIITTKAHLIDGNELPPEFTRFLTSATIWNLYTKKMGGIPERLNELPQKQFPKAFQLCIFSKAQELKETIDQLHKKYGIT